MFNLTKGIEKDGTGRTSADRLRALGINVVLGQPVAPPDGLSWEVHLADTLDIRPPTLDDK